MKKIIFTFLSAFALVMTFTACGGGSGGSVSNTDTGGTSVVEDSNSGNSGGTDTSSGGSESTNDFGVDDSLISTLPGNNGQPE